jgi:uncharacterized iron-regulated protein
MRSIITIQLFAVIAFYRGLDGYSLNSFDRCLSVRKIAKFQSYCRHAMTQGEFDAKDDDVPAHCSDVLPIRPNGPGGFESKQFTRIAAATMTSLSALLLLQPEKSVADSSYPTAPKAADRPKVYSVEMTDPPSLQPRTTRGEEGTISRFADADIVLLGEHHSSKQDHELQANIVSRMLEATKRNSKELVIGLEMVQKGNPDFQAALDAYVRSKKEGISEEAADTAFIAGTDWLKRWVWDFEVYKPIFHLARDRGIPLVALNVLSETQESVKESGLDGLSEIEKQIYVPDTEGFVASVKAPGFQRYTEKVILPSYQFHAENKLLGPNPSPEKFFSSRILWDEGMASSAVTYITEQPANTMMVVLTGLDHVKFGYGIRERALRGLRNFRDRKAAANLASYEALSAAAGGDDKKKPQKPAEASKDVKVLSVLLNPTAQDSLSPTVQLQLCLAYGPFLKDQKPLADFLWFSASPPVKILTRPKNPINSEGEKPAGESSIIGAFSSRTPRVI